MCRRDQLPTACPGAGADTRMLVLVLIMVVRSMGVGSIAIVSLRTAQRIGQQTIRHLEPVPSRARLMEAMTHIEQQAPRHVRQRFRGKSERNPPIALTGVRRPRPVRPPRARPARASETGQHERS